jgi:hypothetical protein
VNILFTGIALSHLQGSDLAILALLPTAVYQKRRGLMEYNLVFVRDGICEIVTVENERRRGLINGSAMVTATAAV